MQVSTCMRKSLYMLFNILKIRRATSFRRIEGIKMKKIILISITLLIFVIGVSCASAASVDTGTGGHLKVKDHKTVKLSKKSSVKKLSVKKSAKKSTKKTAVKKSKKASKKTITFKSEKEINKIINGWDPKKHEVSRKDLGNGFYRISYDDGYFRLVNKDGKIITYGY